MNTSQEVLKSLNLTKSTVNNKVSNHYLNLLKLVKEIKKDVKTVNVLEFQKIEKKFINKWDKTKEHQYYNIFDADYLKTFEILTSFGSYFITVPTNTNFYFYLCVLLNIESSYKKETEVYNVENTIFIDNSVINAILKAKKIVDLKSYNELTKSIVLKLESNFIEIFATDGRILYKSDKFNFTSEKALNNLVLCLPPESIEFLKNVNQNEFLKIDLINEKSILLNDQTIELNVLNVDPIFKMNFEVNEIMEFSKTELLKNIKGLKSLLDYKKQVKFHLNGCINIESNNFETGTKTSLNVAYLSKNFIDQDFIFNYNDIFKLLTNLKSKELIFSPKEKESKKMALITDKKDNYLIIAQNNNK